MNSREREVTVKMFLGKVSDSVKYDTIGENCCGTTKGK